MKPISPERAEILLLRKELRLCLLDSNRWEKAFKDEQDALTLSRSIILGKLRAARVEIASLKAENEHLRSQNEKRLENARTLTESLTKLSAENEALKAADANGADFLGELVAERTKSNPDFPELVEKAVKRRSKKARKQ